MGKLLMISGRSATDTAQGKRNAFYYTLEELHKYFERIDVLCKERGELFGNVFFGPEIPKRFDVMTVQEYAPFRNGRLANKIWKETKIPMIFEIMHIPGMPRAGSWKEIVAKFMTKYYIKHDVRNTVAVRVINAQAQKWLVGRGIPQEKIKLIPAMYIDLDIFKPMNLKKKYDLLFIGRRVANKGINLFEKAAKKLKAKSLIVDGWAKDAFELAKIYNESRLLIVPSYNEGGPRVMLEALACNVPVLATPVGIVPDVVPTEWIIDWDVDDIAEKAGKLLRESPRHNLRAIAERFEKKAAIRRYAESIQQLTYPQ